MMPGVLSFAHISSLIRSQELPKFLRGIAFRVAGSYLSYASSIDG
jgi:hypothetical protein